mgnify:FL=1|tara:strand:+ start:112 stop:645 length:534 start_codon:yes stop_codon:yes gene_type:complete
MKKINKKKGILFWITGLSGSGKTTLGNKIKKEIANIYGPTIMISGDNIRSIFNLNGYTYSDRVKILKKYSKFAKYITNQKINLIFAVVGLVNSARKWNRKNIDNYVEIYVKSKILKIKKLNKKKIYNSNPEKIVGLDIKPEFPKKPDIIINNNFTENTNQLSKKLLEKINKLLNKKI